MNYNSFKELGFSVRLINCLSGAEINSIDKLLNTPKWKLSHYRNFGKMCLIEIEQKLKHLQKFEKSKFNLSNIKNPNFEVKLKRIKSLMASCEYRILNDNLKLIEYQIKHNAILELQKSEEE